MPGVGVVVHDIIYKEKLGLGDGPSEVAAGRIEAIIARLMDDAGRQAII